MHLKQISRARYTSCKATFHTAITLRNIEHIKKTNKEISLNLDEKKMHFS